jgi:hypothetical protein
MDWFWQIYITNLACDELIMKISEVRSFTGSYILHTNVMCWEHIWHTNKCVDGWNTNLWINKCDIKFSSSYKSMCQMCFQSTILVCEMYKLRMNKFCTISIIKLWDVKFVMQSVKLQT